MQVDTQSSSRPRWYGLAAALLAPVLLGAAQPGKLEDKSSGNCLAADCHLQVARQPEVHKPAAAGACDLCHAAKKPVSKHRFSLNRSKEDLCTLCHSAVSPLEFLHKPFAASDCTKCHDPHGGRDKNLLLGDGASGTCRPCHEIPRTRFPHEPVQKGDCGACHEPHQSQVSHLLKSEERKLCSGCHKDVAASLAKARFQHKPVKEGCVSCHSAHGADHEMLLAGGPGPSCLACHKKILSDPTKAGSMHGAVQDKKGCLNCHAAHAGDFEKLLLDSEVKVCLRCHDREITVRPEKKLENIAEKISSAVSVHDPIRKGRCTTCHNPHFSTHERLLREEFPTQPYATFSEGNYKMCFSCHEEQNFTEKTATATGFRDGNRNLHFVHVNRKKGRVCTDCHDPHGSPGPKLVRRSLPFGPKGWKLPIEFTRSADGGSCNKGCHKKASYARTPPPPPAKPGAAPEERQPR